MAVSVSFSEFVDNRKKRKNEFGSRDHALLSESDSSEEDDLKDASKFVDASFVDQAKWPKKREGKCTICVSYTDVWCYNCGQWVCIVHECKCRIRKHHVVDCNRRKFDLINCNAKHLCEILSSD